MLVLVVIRLSVVSDVVVTVELVVVAVEIVVVV